MSEPIAVYIHTPFCPSKCGYCDFNSYAMTGDIMERTTHAIIKEIRQSPLRGINAKTIFFGGGTPTYLAEQQLLSILEAAIECHPPIDNCEITSEANPGTVDHQKFAAMRKAGFNRISLGAQSFLDSDLIQLDRVHKSGDIERAVGAAREAGFDNLNLDLMFALPNQSLRAWESNLTRALALQPEHLSLYCLTIEQNTAFYKKHLKGQLNLPDDETQVAMYDDCVTRTAEAGLEQYEISNFANLKHPDGYCAAVENGEKIYFEHEALTDDTLRTERIMLGLRLNQGIDQSLVKSAQNVEKLVQRDWIQIQNGQIKLSETGRHFCSEVALELM